MAWEWVSEPDACEFCQSMNGTIHEDDESLDELTHPNCRCSQIPAVTEQEIERVEALSQDEIIERTIANLRESIQNLPPFKYEPGTIQYKAYQVMKKIENRINYIGFVYGSKEKAQELINQFGLLKVYLTADLHPMTRKALLFRSGDMTIEEFRKEVRRAFQQGKVRDRKSYEDRYSRPDLRRNPFNIWDEPNIEEEDW
jgi:hypothetical protein